MLDGRKFWLVHGDYFDAVVKYAKWLAYLGDTLYEMALRLNRHYNRVRRYMGLPYWSLSAYLKGKVKKALNFVTDFENAVAHEAKKRGYQGVVCGHIHRAEIRTIEGVLYCNDGDWVESRSALVEHVDGRLELIYWDQVMDELPNANAVVLQHDPLHVTEPA
jgi:UDP-2,3-diacylglucosamine pyrophosphatase LpxH